LRPYWSAIRAADFVYVTLPGFSGIIATLICRVLRRPYGLYFGSDWAELAPFAARWPRGSKMLYRIYRALGSWTERGAVQRASFSAVHGQPLFQRFRNIGRRVVETVPMLSMGTNHTFQRTDTCGGQPVTLLYVGAILPRKGLEYLVEALATLDQRGYRLRLDLVGPPEWPYQTRLSDLVHARELTDSVRFAGYITDLNVLLDYYRASDIFVLPTLGEGFPRVLYEAASQGLPIVTTSIESIAGTLRDGEQALLVPPKDAVALADAIQRVIDNRPLRQSLIRSGYIFAASGVGRGSTAEQVVELVASSREEHDRA
jgi:glycosyltransferase involved in cell wall biosynthesis